MFTRRSLCVITGASRGFGESIAKQFASKLPPSSVIVILARSRDQLQVVKSDIAASSKHVRVIAECFDQENVDDSLGQNFFSNMLKNIDCLPEDFEQTVIVHNAGSLGDVSKLSHEMADFHVCKKYFDLNLSGMMFLNSLFLSTFHDRVKNNVIINISSLLALQPLKGFSLYATGKAARDMYFRVIGEEYSGVRVLSYAPGPLMTKMFTDELLPSLLDEKAKQFYNESLEKGSILECDTSTKRLIEILEKDAFQNAAHVDYYDEL